MAPRILIMSASVGAGHDGAAVEIARRLTGYGFEASTVDYVDLLPAGAGRLLRRAYKTQLAVAPRTWGWLLDGLRRRPAVSRAAVGLVSRAARRRGRAALAGTPVAVVSTYPVASQLLGRLRRWGQLTVPAITFLTDMSVHPMWVAEGVDAHLALHAGPADQARRLGAAGVTVAGAAVRPEFHPGPVPGERAAVRQRYGIPADRPAALVVAGSWGVGDVAAAAADLAATGTVTPVTVCGTNTALRTALGRHGHGPALGWIDQMAPLIRACDLVVQNAGGLTSLEAMACGVPVLSYRCLPGHGTTNAAALAQAGLAGWARQPADLAAVLAAVLADPAAGRRAGAGVTTRDPARVIAELAGYPVPPDPPSTVDGPTVDRPTADKPTADKPPERPVAVTG